MATTKVLGQLAPAASEANTLYTCPSGSTAVSSSVVVCNRSEVGTSFRIAVRPAGATLENKHYIYYNTPIDGNDTFIATIGMTLGSGDIVTAYATLATLSFNLYGQEI